MPLDTVMNICLQGLTLGMLFFLIASGLSLIFGLMDVLNFAHGSLFMVGAYVAWATYEAVVRAVPSTEVAFAIALVSGTLAGALAGAVIELGAIRPLYKRPVFQILLTLGLVYVFTELVKFIWGASGYSMARPTALSQSVEILGRPFPSYRLFIIGLGLTVLIIIHLLLQRTRMGIIIRAGVENADMVQALGINVRRVFTVVFTLGAALAALGGAAAAPFVGVYPEMGLEYLLSAFVVVVIGGIGSFPGSAVGSVVVGLARAFADYKLSPLIAQAMTVGIMGIVLLIKPEGLFGTKRGGH
jgi:branched-chain amino acid transport system permease protein